MVGKPWLLATQEEKDECLRGTKKVHHTDRVRYMGTDVRTKGRITAPANINDMRNSARTELAKVPAAPDTASLIVAAKVLTRFYAVASAYRPMPTTHKESDKTQTKCFKQMVGLSWHSPTEALFATWKQGGLQLQSAEYLWMQGVTREWIRNQHQCMAHFTGAQNAYMMRLEAVIGGCLAVLTPQQHKVTRGGPKLLRALEQVVDSADAPMLLPVDCATATPIITR